LSAFRRWCKNPDLLFEQESSVKKGKRLEEREAFTTFAKRIK
jgi:hypothetical protein